MKIVKLGDLAKKLGFKRGDDIKRIGGYDALDTLDYLYFDNERKFDVELVREGKPHTLHIRKKDGQSLEIEFEEEMKPNVCRNKCIFCFVDQLPKGMRESLYIKDDDYRYSFMCGSYVTMTNVSEQDIERIIRLRLSPLYISVHAYDDDVREFMLKNPHTRKLIAYMRRLGENGIKMHTQLVVVPGVNDGKVLENSIRSLKTIDGVETVAVVPVGLTEHRAKLANLKAVDELNAKETIKLVERLHCELDGFCWCSDEYYVKAGLSVKDCLYYGAFDQIENGVGLIADFKDNLDYSLDEVEECKLQKRVGFITGVSFAPMLEEFVKPVEKKLGIEARVHAIQNDFFGHSVTVAGLVTAGDIIKQIESESVDLYVIPDNMLREFSDTFLDNLTLDELKIALKTPVLVVSHNGADLAQKLVEFFKS